MSLTQLSGQQLHDAAPLGALVRFSDGAAEPPQRHRRKHATWRSGNGAPDPRLEKAWFELVTTMSTTDESPPRTREIPLRRSRSRPASASG